MGKCKNKTMRDIFIFILVFTLYVAMYVSQDISSKQTLTRQNDFNENPDVVSSQTDVIKEKSLDNNPCYGPHLKCVKKMNFLIPKPTCVHNKKLGLMNYYNLCEINLQICISGQVNGENSTQLYGTASEDGKIYYNGKEFACQYYLRRSKTTEDTIKMYYKLGKDKKIK